MNKNPYRNSEEYKAKRNEYVRKYYAEKYKTQQIKNNTRYKKKNQIWLKQLKKTLCCSKCGENHPACLDFHHNDPKMKKYNIHKMSGKGCSQETILEEIAKCTILCSNCHRKHHWKDV